MRTVSLPLTNRSFARVDFPPHVIRNDISRPQLDIVKKANPHLSTDCDLFLELMAGYCDAAETVGLDLEIFDPSEHGGQDTYSQSYLIVPQDADTKDADELLLMSIRKSGSDYWPQFHFYDTETNKMVKMKQADLEAKVARTAEPIMMNMEKLRTRVWGNIKTIKDIKPLVGSRAHFDAQAKRNQVRVWAHMMPKENIKYADWARMNKGQERNRKSSNGGESEAASRKKKKEEEGGDADASDNDGSDGHDDNNDGNEVIRRDELMRESGCKTDEDMWNYFATGLPLSINFKSATDCAVISRCYIAAQRQTDTGNHRTNDIPQQVLSEAYEEANSINFGVAVDETEAFSQWRAQASSGGTGPVKIQRIPSRADELEDDDDETVSEDSMLGGLPEVDKAQPDAKAAGDDVDDFLI